MVGILVTVESLKEGPDKDSESKDAGGLLDKISFYFNHSTSFVSVIIFLTSSRGRFRRLASTAMNPRYLNVNLGSKS